MYGIFTYIWLIFYGKCTEVYHAWMIWVMTGWPTLGLWMIKSIPLKLCWMQSDMLDEDSISIYSVKPIFAALLGACSLA